MDYIQVNSRYINVLVSIKKCKLFFFNDLFFYNFVYTVNMHLYFLFWVTLFMCWGHLYAATLIQTPYSFPKPYFESYITWDVIASQNSSGKYSYSSPAQMDVWVEASMDYHPRFKLFQYDYHFYNATSSDAKVLYLGIEKQAICTDVRAPNGFQEIKKNNPTLSDNFINIKDLE